MFANVYTSWKQLIQLILGYLQCACMKPSYLGIHPLYSSIVVEATKLPMLIFEFDHKELCDLTHIK